MKLRFGEICEWPTAGAQMERPYNETSCGEICEWPTAGAQMERPYDETSFR
jgi:hypothetical protein